MDLTVLGCSGTFPVPGRAASGYLVGHRGYRIYMDAGPGTFANLLRYLDVVDISAVFLSHSHPDHCVDLYSLFYALRFHPEAPKGVPVYGPRGICDHLWSFISTDVEQVFREIFVFHELDDGDKVSLGPLTLSVATMNHPVATLGARLDVDGRSLTYSADTGPTEALVDLAKDSSLFLCEATYHASHPGPPLHLTAAEAAEHAASAGAQTLMLTHIRPGIDQQASLAEARAHFSGEVLLAAQGLRVRV